MRLRYQYRVPIIGRQVLNTPGNRIAPKSPLWHVLNGSYTASDYKNHVEEWEKSTRDISLIKPGRRLGGGWIDSFVSQHRTVSLCADCEKKYGDWHIRHQYNKRDEKAVSDCDGCGESMKDCSQFYSALQPSRSTK